MSALRVALLAIAAAVAVAATLALSFLVERPAATTVRGDIAVRAAAGAAAAPSAVTGLAAFAGNLALLRRVHRRKSTLQRHAHSPT